MAKKIKAKYKKSDELSTGLIPVYENFEKLSDKIHQKIGLLGNFSDEEYENIYKYYEKEIKIIHEEFEKTYSTKLPDHANSIIHAKSKELGVEISSTDVAIKIFERRSINNKSKGVFKKLKNPSDRDMITKKELIEMIIEIYHEIIKTINPSQQNKTERRLSTFKMLKNIGVGKLRKELIKNKLIKEVNAKDFRPIFLEVDIKEIKPLIWTAKTMVLIHFIRKLIEDRIIEGNTKRMNYEQIKACFRDSKGEIFNNAFAPLNHQIKKNLDENLSEGNVIKIDKIIKDSF